MGKSRRWITLSATLFLILLTTANGIGFYSLLAQKKISSNLPFPFSFAFAAALLGILLRVWKCRGNAGNGNPISSFESLKVGLVAAAAVLVFPLLQMAFFGKQITAAQPMPRSSLALVFTPMAGLPTPYMNVSGPPAIFTGSD